MSTKISWTNDSWNPVTGCSKVSDGCRACYAEALSLRFGWSEKPWTAGNAPENVKTHEERLRKPLSWREPRRVFVHALDLKALIEALNAELDSRPQTYE